MYEKVHLPREHRVYTLQEENMYIITVLVNELLLLSMDYCNKLIASGYIIQLRYSIITEAEEAHMEPRIQHTVGVRGKVAELSIHACRVINS